MKQVKNLRSLSKIQDKNKGYIMVYSLYRTSEHKDGVTDYNFLSKFPANQFPIVVLDDFRLMICNVANDYLISMILMTLGHGPKNFKMIYRPPGNNDLITEKLLTYTIRFEDEVDELDVTYPTNLFRGHYYCPISYLRFKMPKILVPELEDFLLKNDGYIVKKLKNPIRFQLRILLKRAFVYIFF